MWSARDVNRRLGALSGAAVLVAVALIVVVAPRRTGTHREQIGAPTIVMLGDSITEQADWDSLLPDLPIVNQGHSGFTTEQLVPIADSIGEARPRLVLVLTGTNDIRDGRSPDWTAFQLGRVLDALGRRSPDTTVVIQTILPRADQPDAVRAANDAVKAVAASRAVRVLDLHEAFDDGAGGLRSNETTDGVHLSTGGYRRWAALIAPLIAAVGGEVDTENVTGS